MQCYRVSKYNPIHRDSNGVYHSSEWTSFGDIGRLFGGCELTIEKYNEVENGYLQIVMDILRFCNVSRIIIKNLEVSLTVEEIRTYLSDRGVYLNEKEEYILKNIQNLHEVQVDDFDILFRLILKECFWCILYTDKRVFIKFGYDLYVYVFCEDIPEYILKNRDGVYTERIVRWEHLLL